MSRRHMAAVKAVVAAGCLVPLGWILMRAFGLAETTLGANPVETLLHTFGKTSLNILFLTLAVTPLRMLTRIHALIRLRRMLGLFSFFYLVLHFLTYAVLDWRLQWGTLWVDITERPYITVGMLALLAMIPLAVTSTQAMQRRLGRRWAQLHKLVYPIAVLGVVHFYWQVKADLSEPLVYAGVLTVLLGYRAQRSIRVQRRMAAASRS